MKTDKQQETEAEGRRVGFGLYNDSTTGQSPQCLLMFVMHGQMAVATVIYKVFTVDTTTTPPTVGINGNLIVDGSIVGEKISVGAKIQLG